VEFNTCLNLTNPQFVASTSPKAPPVPPNPQTQVPFKPRFGPRPAIQPEAGQVPASGFRSAAAAAVNGSVDILAFTSVSDGIFLGSSTGQGSVQIMANPNRNGRGPLHGRGGYSNGRSEGRPVPGSTTEHVGANSGAAVSENDTSPPRLYQGGKGVERHGSHPHPPYAGRGLARGGPRGGHVPGLRGRGGFGGGSGFERGRAAFRGRGRGAFISPPVPS